MKRLFFILILIPGISAFAQSTTESLTSFNRIDVFGPFKVELIKADKELVELEYRNIDRDDIITTVNKGTLNLKVRNKHYFDEWSSNDYPKTRYIKVKVYYTEIDDIEAQAGAQVASSGAIKSKNLAIEASMGAEIRLHVISKNLYTKLNMGAIMDLEGQTENLEVKANMGAVLNATQLASKVVYVNANMGAEVEVRASDEIEVNAGFGATVDYKGSPSVRHTSRNFGGEIRGYDN